MPFIPVLIVLILLGIAVVLCGWRVSSACVATAIICPSVFLSVHALTGLGKDAFSFKDLGAAIGLYVLAGLPYLFIVIAPLYFLLSRLPYPVVYVFPPAFALLSMAVIFFIATKTLDLKEMIIAFAYASSGGMVFLGTLRVLQWIKPL